MGEIYILRLLYIEFFAIPPHNPFSLKLSLIIIGQCHFEARAGIRIHIRQNMQRVLYKERQFKSVWLTSLGILLFAKLAKKIRIPFFDSSGPGFFFQKDYFKRVLGYQVKPFIVDCENDTLCRKDCPI
jgi:hypothetical protein